MFLTLLIMLLLIASCNHGTKEIQENSSVSENSEGAGSNTSQYKEQVLLIIAEDRSGSTKNQRKLTSEKYQQIFNKFNERYCGEIDVIIIGNPSPEDREFYPLIIECPSKLNSIPKKALLTEKARIKKENEKILNENKKLIQINKKKIDKFIQDIIQPKIINYKPYQGKDVTDIITFLEHLNKKINEPTYKNYNQIMVVIISDGIHDAFQTKKPFRFKCNPKLQLNLIGWKDKTIFENCNIEEFESIDGFIHYFSKNQ